MSELKRTLGPWKFDGPHTIEGAPDSRCFSIFTETPSGALSVAAVIFNPVQGDDTELSDGLGPFRPVNAEIQSGAFRRHIRASRASLRP